MNEHKYDQTINDISEVEVKNVDIDFSIANLLTEYQLPPKVKKTKKNSQKNSELKHTTQSSMSTKQKTKEDSEELEVKRKNRERTKSKSSSSLTKNSQMKNNLKCQLQNANSPFRVEKPCRRQPRSGSKYQPQLKERCTSKTRKQQPIHIKVSRKTSNAKVSPSSQELVEPMKTVSRQRMSSRSKQIPNYIVTKTIPCNIPSPCRSSRSDSQSSWHLNKHQKQTQIQNRYKRNQEIIITDYYGESENTPANKFLKKQRVTSKSQGSNLQSRKRSISRNKISDSKQNFVKGLRKGKVGL